MDPSGRPYAAFSFLAVLLAACVLFSAARCNEPGTRAVIFVQGLYTSLDEDGTQASFAEEHRFGVMKEAFLAADYKPEQLLDFSYEGGAADLGGAWQPQPYGCEVTDRPALESVQKLEAMVRAYRKAHPKAKITLVGHSLGGYIAFLAGIREAERPEGARLGIDGVVTLDAPLAGASADKKVILDLILCEKTYVAGAELVALRADPSIGATRESQAASMAAAGVRLATFGNLLDCLFRTTVCAGGTWADDAPTQFIATAELSKSYEVASEPLQSHDVILIDPGVMTDVVAFVGNP
jgi:pimeloyl-ACP methyl ester carboxylesterase